MDHLKHLSKDKKLDKIIKDQEPFLLQKRNKVYLRLCSSILSQQLNIKVAAVLYKRFIDLYNGKEPTPQQILDTPAEKFRSIGFSNAKAAYVHNVCDFFISQKLTDTKIAKLDNEQVIELLTQIKGIGRWTVEMILMFTLGREDVIAIDDLGIKQRMVSLYKLDESDKKLLREEMTTISNKWRPYRTYACRYLWNWDNKS